jgi:hypothetical protein
MTIAEHLHMSVWRAKREMSYRQMRQWHSRLLKQGKKPTRIEEYLARIRQDINQLIHPKKRRRPLKEYLLKWMPAVRKKPSHDVDELNRLYLHQALGISEDKHGT